MQQRVNGTPKIYINERPYARRMRLLLNLTPYISVHSHSLDLASTLSQIRIPWLIYTLPPAIYCSMQYISSIIQLNSQFDRHHYIHPTITHSPSMQTAVKFVEAHASFFHTLYRFVNLRQSSPTCICMYIPSPPPLYIYIYIYITRWYVRLCVG